MNRILKYNSFLKKIDESTSAIDLFDKFSSKEIKNEKGNYKLDQLKEIIKESVNKNLVLISEKLGQMKYNPLVEASQICLEYLGFSLPKFGPDGLFGPETEKSVIDYKTSKNIETNKQSMDAPFFSNLLIDIESKGMTQNDIDNIYKKYEKVVVTLSSEEDKEFYEKILVGLGANVTDEKMKFFQAWRQAEGGTAMNNPFNTTKNYPGATNYNSVGVKNYQTREDGLNATIDTLRLHYYQDLVSRLRDDTMKASDIAKSPDLKTWGTGELVTTVLQSSKINPPPIYSAEMTA